MTIISNNSKHRFVFFDKIAGTIKPDLLSGLRVNIGSSLNLSAHENNISNFVSRPDVYREVVEGIVPIPPRSNWIYDGINQFICANKRTVPTTFKPIIPDLIRIISKLATVLNNKKIAVELSGGLDTAIIIGILRHIGFNPFLIGVESLRYEFRAERSIQKLYFGDADRVVLINNEETLPFTNLLDVPIHQLPSSSSLYHAHAARIAAECEVKGIDLLFSGMGLDALFCDDTQTNTDSGGGFPESWHSWMLDDNWFNEYIFQKHKTCYKSAAASTLLVKAVWALRKEQGEDTKKWWARKTFAPFLPHQLINYAYKSDNTGIFISGFIRALDEIREIFKATYFLTGFTQFAPDQFDLLCTDINNPDEAKIKLIMARVSFATWIYCLLRNDFLK